MKNASGSTPTDRNLPATGLADRFLRLLGFGSTQAESTLEAPKAAPDPARCLIFIGGVRTGTTVFREMLATHPAVVNRHEIFNSGNKAGFYPFLRDLVQTEPEAVLPEHAMENFSRFLASGCEPGKISVFDLKYEHLLHLPIAWQLPFTKPHILDFLASRGFKIIHLRRNPLHSLISNIIAYRSKRYHDYQPEISATSDPDTGVSIRVNRAEIIERMAVRQQVTALIDKTFPHAQRRSFDYESIFTVDGKFKDEVCAEVASFIGIEDRFDRQTRLGKVITRPLVDLVENYAEIKDLDQY